MYRIYINESVLIIAKYAPTPVQNQPIVELTHFDIANIYKDTLSENKPRCFFSTSNNIQKKFQEFKQSLNIIQAAGGLVKNEHGQYLFIFRKDKWDLPKGKIEKGEKIPDAARREVEEECGIEINQVADIIETTYHIYQHKNQIILKETFWYAMDAIDQFDLVPQVEEDITEVRWLATSDLSMVKQNTYPLINAIIQTQIESV